MALGVYQARNLVLLLRLIVLSQADRFNAVITEARSETDEAKRRSQYFEAQRLLHDDGGAIVAMWANYIHAHSKKLTHGPDVAANWINDGNKVSERWWFA